MLLLACRRVVLRLVAATAVAFFVAPTWAADPPIQLIETVSVEVVDLVKSQTGAAREAGIRKVLQTSFDLPYMGQAALGRHWNQTTEEQRVRFLKAAESAEARAYSERFGQYAGQTVTIKKLMSRPGGVFIVDSQLNQSNGQPIKLEWEIRDNGQGLRITDVKVEGVSMVMTRRSDFNSYIQKNGGTVEPLIKELEARAAK